MKTGLYIGRFQPFHLGHLSAVKQALAEVDKLIIGIGSSQYSGMDDNPFTASKRAEMIQKALQESGIAEESFQVVEIPDIHDNPKWPFHVRSIVPEFDVLFVGDHGLVKELFEKYDSVPVQVVNRELDISATKIREALKKGQSVEHLVAASTLELLT